MRTILLAVALIGATSANADILGSSDTGFTSEYRLMIAAPPAKVWDALVHPDRWWESGHTYSGSAANLSLDARPGGCWCEKTATGGVEHMRVIYVATGDTLRMTGGLGPLQSLPVNAVMTITLKPSGAGTQITATYVVGGSGLASLAAPVDQVLGTQRPRLKAAAER